eukprot:3315618-Prorocentrum_lima.AAC.1
MPVRPLRRRRGDARYLLPLCRTADMPRARLHTAGLPCCELMPTFLEVLYPTGAAEPFCVVGVDWSQPH